VEGWPQDAVEPFLAEAAAGQIESALGEIAPSKELSGAFGRYLKQKWLNLSEAIGLARHR